MHEIWASNLFLLTEPPIYDNFLVDVGLHTVTVDSKQASAVSNTVQRHLPRRVRVANEICSVQLRQSIAKEKKRKLTMRKEGLLKKRERAVGGRGRRLKPVHKP